MMDIELKTDYEMSLEEPAGCREVPWIMLGDSIGIPVIEIHDAGKVRELAALLIKAAGILEA